MLILVQPYPPSCPNLGNITFAADVGFGGLLGPIRPLLLADGTGVDEQRVPLVGSTGGDNQIKGGWVWGTFPPVRHRLVKGAHYASSLGTVMLKNFR